MGSVTGSIDIDRVQATCFLHSGLLAAMMAVLPCAASASGFLLKPVTVPNGTSPYLSAISGSGILAGSFIAVDGEGNGFLIQGSHTTILPNLFPGTPGGTPVTYAILDDGTAAGAAYNGGGYTGYVWSKGQYVTDFPGGSIGGTPFVSINRSGALAFDDYLGDGDYTVYAGTPPNFTEINPPGSFPYAISINKGGTISGTFSLYLPSIFLLNGATYTTIAYPGANATNGGYLNDENVLAGTYQDAANGWHGFLEKDGKYKKFDAPLAPTAMQVDGLSNTGYVTGTYADSRGLQHGFLYHKGRFNHFGNWPQTTLVKTVGVSDAGEVALDIQGQPFVAVCKSCK
jgi:hypothetical protein